jgi:hypothetical protein
MFFLDRADGKTSGALHGLARALLGIARHYVRLPELELDQLRRMCRRLDAYVNELRPTLLTNVGSPWLQWLLITDAARPSQPARPFGAVQKAARRPCRVANTLIMRQRLAWPGCV